MHQPVVQNHHDTICISSMLRVSVTTTTTKKQRKKKKVENWGVYRLSCYSFPYVPSPVTMKRVNESIFRFPNRKRYTTKRQMDIREKIDPLASPCDMFETRCIRDQLPFVYKESSNAITQYSTNF